LLHEQCIDRATLTAARAGYGAGSRHAAAGCQQRDGHGEPNTSCELADASASDFHVILHWSPCRGCVAHLPRQGEGAHHRWNGEETYREADAECVDLSNERVVERALIADDSACAEHA